MMSRVETDANLPQDVILFIVPRKPDWTDEEWIKHCAVIYNVGLPEPKENEK